MSTILWKLSHLEEIESATKFSYYRLHSDNYSAYQGFPFEMLKHDSHLATLAVKPSSLYKAFNRCVDAKLSTVTTWWADETDGRRIVQPRHKRDATHARTSQQINAATERKDKNNTTIVGTRCCRRTHEVPQETGWFEKYVPLFAAKVW